MHKLFTIFVQLLLSYIPLEFKEASCAEYQRIRYVGECTNGLCKVTLQNKTKAIVESPVFIGDKFCIQWN